MGKLYLLADVVIDLILRFMSLFKALLAYFEEEEEEEEKFSKHQVIEVLWALQANCVRANHQNRYICFGRQPSSYRQHNCGNRKNSSS